MNLCMAAKKLMKQICLVVLVVFLDLNWSLAADENIEYVLKMTEPQTHYFQVEMRLKNFKSDQLDLKMPVWAPGSYLVREFSKNVESFSVKNISGEPLVSHKVSKNTWRIFKNNQEDIVVTYKIYAFEASVRTSFLDDAHGFVNGSSVFMFVDKYQHLSATLQIIPCTGWEKITTALKSIEAERNKFYVPNYDILVDSPIEIGNQTEFEFEANGIPHHMAFFGPGNFNQVQISKDIPKIIAAETAIFGENPNEDYTFIIHNVAEKYTSGLEHLNSCALDVYRWIYQPEGTYEKFLSLVAHEYFHLWLVKRIRPQSLMQYDYNQENYTDLLWVMEGFTSYYDELILDRAGFFDDQTYIEHLIKSITKLQNRKGDQVEDVAESSFDAWIKFYRHNENSKNSQTDYYTKGAILGAMLDLDIIHNSLGKYRLDNVLNYLYYKYYKKGKGVTSDDLKQVLEHFGGHKFDDFFNQYVYGTQGIDYKKYLDYAGIKLIETNTAISDKALGIDLKKENNRLIISGVQRGSAGWEDGLNVNDEIIAINNFRINNEDDIKFYVNQVKKNDPVVVLVDRNGILRSIQVYPQRSNNVAYTFEYSSNRTKQQERTFNIWLGSSLKGQN